jgi:lipopolysaccharide transport system permease protein
LAAPAGAGMSLEMTSALARAARPKPYVQALLEVLSTARLKRHLVLELARKQIAREHAGKTFGLFWGIFQPLFLFGVYALIYGVVFRVKIGGTFELPRNFTIYLLAGLVPWLAFLFLMARATTLLTGNAQLVKQVVFELSLLPIAQTIASCLALVLGLGFVGVYTLVAYASLPVTYLALPLVLVLQFLAMLGAAFALSAIGVFFRDVGDLVQVAGVVLIFLLPIVYLPSAVPSAFQYAVWANPFSYMVWCYQDVLYFGRLEHPEAWVVFTVLALFLFAGGYRLFRRLRPHYADVL